MAEPTIMIDKGISGHDEIRLPAGFLVSAENWVYSPDDPDRPFKIAGRTSAGALPGAATANNTKGFGYLEYSNADNQFLLYANSQLYETDASASIGAWTSVVDKQAVPVAFPRAGDFFKVISDNTNRWIAFTGREGERALVRDEDGDWRYLSLLKPLSVTAARITASASDIVPAAGADNNPASTDFGTVTKGGFTSPSLARDGNKDTYSYKQVTSPGVAASDWGFTTVGTTGTSGYKLFVKCAISGAPLSDAGDRGSGDYEREPRESVVAALYIQVSTDTSTTWTTIFSGRAPMSGTIVQYDLPNNTAWTAIDVRVVFVYTSGTQAATAYVHEIWANLASSAPAVPIDAGTYSYSVVEVYQVTLDSGEIIIVESAPSDPVSITVSTAQAAGTYGILLTIPTKTNDETMGIKHDVTNLKLHFRKIFRTTKTGVWPDLGYIGDAAITATTFADTFATAGTELGTPGLRVSYAGVSAVNTAGVAPAFRDATYFGGAIVGIPADDPTRIQWSIPGQADYFPLPAHDLPLLPSARNDRAVGIASIGEYLLVFLRTRVLRIRDLPLVDRSAFDPGQTKVDILSPNEGLVGSPRSFCSFESEKGFSVVAWVSDNGIWMTDGALPSEQGLGIVKLSQNLNWRKLVDPTRLDESVMTFDSVEQTVWFDYVDNNGDRKTLSLHTAPFHWVQGGAGSAVPKFMGPHTKQLIDRAVGELSGAITHWSLSTENLVIYNERTGVSDNGSNIISVLETGWNYPAGSKQEFHFFTGLLYHSDWGPSDTCDLDLLLRRDDGGVTQNASKRGVSLAGARITSFFIDRAGKSVKMRIRHEGKTSSTGRTPLAVGPVDFEGEPLGELFGS